MSTILKGLGDPLKSTRDAIAEDTIKLERTTENALDTVGNYLLFGLTISVLVGIPFINYVSGKVPELIDASGKLVDQAAKVASIVKPF